MPTQQNSGEVHPPRGWNEAECCCAATKTSILTKLASSTRSRHESSCCGCLQDHRVTMCLALRISSHCIASRMRFGGWSPTLMGNAQCWMCPRGQSPPFGRSPHNCGFFAPESFLLVAHKFCIYFPLIVCSTTHFCNDQSS